MNPDYKKKFQKCKNSFHSICKSTFGKSGAKNQPFPPLKKVDFLKVVA